MSSPLKVTIITATYNSSKTILDTIDSVLEQKYPNIQHLIIDGLSTDNTIDLIKNTNFTGEMYSGKDKGIYDAMNKGIALAKGDIIGILNSDDYYADDSVIEKVVALFEETGCDAVYGDLLYVDAIDTNTIKRNWVSGRYNRENFLKGWMPPHPTFFVRKELYNKYGDFNISLSSAADYELMLRFLFKHRVKLEYLEQTLVHMRVGGKSNVSIKNRIIANLEDRKAWKINGLKPKWYTLFLKPVRKLGQFFFRSYK